MEFEAVDEGKITKILVPEGTDGVKVGQPIALLAGEGEQRQRCGARRRPRSRRSRKSRRCPRRNRSRTKRRPRRMCSRPPRATLSPTSPRRTTIPRCRKGRRLVTMTVREALRDAMAEEMRTRRARLRDGRGSRRISGRLQGHAGPAQEFGPKRVIDTPITEYGFAGHRLGRGDGRPSPDRRVHDLQLRDAGDRPHHQFGRQDQLHVGRPDALPDRLPRAQRRRGSRRRPAQPELRASWYASVPGLVVIAPYSAADAKGLLKAAIRTDDPVVFLENELLYGQHFDVPQLDDYVLPIGKARIVRPGKDVTIVSYSIGVGCRARSRAGADGAGDQRRGDRPSHASPARQGDRARKPASAPTAWWSSRRAGRSARSAPRSSRSR